MRPKSFYFIRCFLTFAVLFSPQLNAQELANPPIKCRYVFQDYRIYCLALRDTVLVSNIKLEGADPIFCQTSPTGSFLIQNNYKERIYDRGELIHISLGNRCSIKSFAVEVSGKIYHFSDDEKN